MAMDMNPQVGRIMLGRARSLAFYHWYEPAGEITRISGKRVYYKDAEGTERFLHEYSAIVDTKEEEDLLLDFTAHGKKMVDALLKELHDENERLTLSITIPPLLRGITGTKTGRTRSARPEV